MDQLDQVRVPLNNLVEKSSNPSSGSSMKIPTRVTTIHRMMVCLRRKPARNLRGVPAAGTAVVRPAVPVVIVTSAIGMPSAGRGSR